MHKQIVNGVEITTNFRERKFGYPSGSGNGNYNEKLEFNETDEECLERMVAKGYTRITFYELATSIRGYHHIYLKCK